MIVVTEDDLLRPGSVNREETVVGVQASRNNSVATGEQILSLIHISEPTRPY